MSIGRQGKGINNESRSGSICTVCARRTDDHTKLDKAGETILQLLNKAADVADGNSRRAMDIAQKFSDQLRAAEDRVAELEAEVAAYQEKAERAEQWLHRVYTEIEERFLQQNDGRRSVIGAPQRPQMQGVRAERRLLTARSSRIHSSVQASAP